MYDVHLDVTWLDEVPRVARVLPPVLRPRPLDDEGGDRGGGLVGDHAHPAAGGGVVDRLEEREKNRVIVGNGDLALAFFLKDKNMMKDGGNDAYQCL